MNPPPHADDAPHTVRIALCTCPDQAVADTVADALISGRHAACVNIVPRIVSVYRWEGDVQRDDEVLLIIKTTAAAWAGLEKAIREAHPYELPEIIAVPVEDGLAGYLAWVREETAQ